MTEAPEEWSIESSWIFRDSNYSVSADVREDVLVLQVEEKLTGNRWRGQFEPKHIEELTRKTGNFKKFPVFLNMLESAITKSSKSVILDLLTYEDLEAMWKKKLGTDKRGKRDSSNPHAKRYLILTYNVEFDRIHYPLALSYCGCPDPVVLQDVIRELQAELKKQTMIGGELSGLAHLQEENSFLAQEKDRLEEELLSYKHQVTLKKSGNSMKEVRILRRVVKNLEEEVLKERSKYQKYINKKNQEVKDLLQQVKRLQSSERLLQTKVKSLTKELASFKRGYRTPASYGLQRSSERQVSDPGARQRKYSHNINSTTTLKKTKRKLSLEHKLCRSRTPSPYGTRISRFDPTAYIEQKRKQQSDIRKSKAAANSADRGLRSLSNSAEKRGRGNHESLRRSFKSKHLPPTRVLSSNNSCNSSLASCHLHSYQSPVQSESEGIDLLNCESENRKSWKRHEPQRTDISEIDARLNALQEFMKRSLESAKNFTRS